MANVEFTDNSVQVKEAINDAIIAWLYEAAGEMQTQVKRNTKVVTGELKGSWHYTVDEGELKATVGSPSDNAIWNEFGTGQWALNGDGRKTPWKYKDIKGKWHTTTGKKPRRSLHYAYESNKTKIKTALENKLKGL